MAAVADGGPATAAAESRTAVVAAFVVQAFQERAAVRIHSTKSGDGEDSSTREGRFNAEDRRWNANACGTAEKGAEEHEGARKSMEEHGRARRSAEERGGARKSVNADERLV